MSRFFRTSSTPITDYGYKAPIEAITMGLGARQQSYDTNKAAWEAQIQAIQDTPYLTLGLGDEEAHAKLMDKYQKMADEAAANGDFSQMGRQLDYIKREVAKDYGINGPGSALKGRYDEYAKWADDYKKGVEKGTYYEGDDARFTSSFNKFTDDKNQINSLGVPSLAGRPDYQKRITDFMKAVIKDDKDAKIKQDASGRFFIKTKYGGVKEEELNKQLNAFVESLPGHKEWRQWDLNQQITGLKNPDGSVNTNSNEYQDAENLVAESMLEAKSKIEKIDSLLKDKSIGKDYRQQLLDEKEYTQRQFEEYGTYKEGEIQNIAANSMFSDYNKKITDPYMGRANWGISDISMKDDPYRLADYKHAFKLDEIDYKNKQSLTQLVMLPGQIVPLDEKTTEQAFNDIKANYKEINKDFNKASVSVFSELAQVDASLKATLDKYNNASGAEKIRLEDEINKKVRGWYKSYRDNPDATGSYKSILEKNMPDYDHFYKNWKDQQIIMDKAENSSRLNAEVIMTDDLKNNIKDFRDYLTENGAVIPPELKDVFNSGDDALFVSRLLSTGKLDKNNVTDFLYKLNKSSGKPVGKEFEMRKKLFSLLQSYTDATSAKEKGESYKSTNSNEIIWANDSKDKKLSINENFNQAIDASHGYAGLMSMNGQTVAANEKKAIGDGKIESREAVLTDVMYNGTPYMKVTTTYKDKSGATKYFEDQFEVPTTEIGKYLDSFQEIATQPGSHGKIGRIALGRYEVGDTFQAGDFLYNSKHNIPTLMGTNNEYKIVPVRTIEGGISYELYYSPDQSDPEPDNRDYVPVTNPYNSDPQDHSIGDINTIFELIGRQ